MDASCNVKLADFGLAIDQKFEQANTRLVRADLPGFCA